jgi:hypothetical protein
MASRTCHVNMLGFTHMYYPLAGPRASPGKPIFRNTSADVGHIGLPRVLLSAIIARAHDASAAACTAGASA